MALDHAQMQEIDAKELKGPCSMAYIMNVKNTTYVKY